MRKPRVLYYIHTYFLDSCLETLQSIKHDTDIDLIIEVSPDSLKSTVFEIDNIEQYKRVEFLQDILSQEAWFRFSPYMAHIHSARLIFFKGKSMLSFDSVYTGLFLGRMIQAGKYDAIHFDTASGRALSCLLFLFKQRLVVTIHDPVMHSGEASSLLNFVRSIYTRLASSLIFYSYHSLNSFVDHNNNIKPNLFRLFLQPYSFIAKLNNHSVQKRNHILFFGQLSYYKGIDFLLNAIPKVLEKYPNEQFLIAGKSFGFSIDYSLIKKYSNNIVLLDEYLSIEELSNCIAEAKFIVCPYREATQSGVLMTAFAMGRTVMATRQGAFPEYIDHNVNGILSDTNPNSIAQGMLSMLDNDHFLTLEKNVNPFHSENASKHNRKTMSNVYGILQSPLPIPC